MHISNISTCMDVNGDEKNEKEEKIRWGVQMERRSDDVFIFYGLHS